MATLTALSKLPITALPDGAGPVDAAELDLYANGAWQRQYVESMDPLCVPQMRDIEEALAAKYEAKLKRARSVATQRRSALASRLQAAEAERRAWKARMASIMNQFDMQVEERLQRIIAAEATAAAELSSQRDAMRIEIGKHFRCCDGQLRLLVDTVDRPAQRQERLQWRLFAARLQEEAQCPSLLLQPVAEASPEHQELADIYSPVLRKMLKRELGADGRGDPVIRHIFRITSQARQSLGELSPAEISLTDRVRATTSPRGSAARDGSHGLGQRRAQRSWASRLYRAPLTVDVLPRLLRGLRAGAMSASSSSFSSSSSSPPSSSDQQQVRPSSAACPRDGSPAARVVRTVPLDSYPLSTYLSSRVLGWLDQTACDIVRPYAFTTHGETHQDQPAQPPFAATTNVALYYCVQERCVDATASSSACFSRDLSGWEVAPCDEDGQAEENLPPPLHAALPFSMLRAVEQPSSAQQQQGGGASSEPAPTLSPQHASVAVATVGHLIETMRGITGAFPYNP